MKNLFTALFVMVLIPGLILANIIHVPTDQPTIQAGINAAVNGDTVLVADSTYYENIDFKGKAITVASHFLIDGNSTHIDSSIIDGSQPSHPDSGSVVCFQSDEDTTSVLCGFTITGGSGTHIASINRSGGGGIGMFSGGKIRNNKITGNQIHVVTQQEIGGGGLAFAPSNNTNLIVEHNEFTQNSLSGPVNANGGGLWLGPRWNNGYIRVNNNLVSNNSVTCTGTYKAMGGGIGVSINLPTKGTIIIEKNLISNNYLYCIASIGGGIYIVYWDPGHTITDDNPSPLICNNIIKKNYSEGLGGGIGIWTVEYGGHYPNSNIKPQPAIINNTIANNIAQDGCGIFNFDSYPLLMNNIFWDDLSASGSSEIFDNNINFAPYVPPYHDPYNDGEVFVRYSDIQDSLWSGEGNLSIDPLFVPGDSLLNLEYTIDTSRCLNSGIDSIVVNGKWCFTPQTDYAGNQRPQPIGTPPDMGAWEYDVVNALENVQSITFPKTFSLKQNYPNPFNPSTTIEFSIPKTEFVTLKIYNLLGQEVGILVADMLIPGNYKYTWDASAFASGIYYYKIDAGKFAETRKMILLR
ncbi:T9SS type A sorting domain-containing protein [Calditrichota bacterium]